MTTPTNPQSKSPAVELLEVLVETTETQSALLQDLTIEIKAMLSVIFKIADGIKAAAVNTPAEPARPAAALQAAAGNDPGYTYTDIEANSLIMTYNEKGEPAYKITGFPYNTFGVRVWPEVLPDIGVDPSTLKPGPNPFDAIVRVRMVESSTTPGKWVPKKVVGLSVKV